MKGGIFSDQVCQICGKRFKHFDPRGLWCPDHPQQMPNRFVVRFGKLTKRFHSYEESFRALNGFRWETDQQSFDIRDYQKDQPLGFANLVEKWINSKRNIKAVKKYEQRIRFAVTAWGNRNIKSIKFGDIEDLMLSLQDSGKASKYRHDILNCIKQFFDWCYDREEIDRIPKFPKVKAIMAFRKIVSREDQERILAEVELISRDFNRKIYIGILFLSTYINVRPNELCNIKEKHIELDNERILIPDPKEGFPKYVNLIPEDVELLRSFPKSFPEMYFFRHGKGNGQARPGQKFGSDYLWKWWRKACLNLNIDGVSLYPGTRHSTAVNLRKENSPESIKRGSGHRSNKAFERYLLVDAEEQRELYTQARRSNVVDIKQKQGK